MEPDESPWSAFKHLERQDRQWMLLREVIVEETIGGRTWTRTRFEYEALTPERARETNDPETRKKLVCLTEREAFWRLFELGIEAIRDEHRTIGAGQVSMFRCLKVVLTGLKAERSTERCQLSFNEWADVLTAALRKIVRQEAREASGHTRNREKAPGTDVVALRRTSVSDYRATAARKASKEFREQLKEQSLPTVTRRMVQPDGTEQYVKVTLIPTYKPKGSTPAVKHNASQFRLHKDNHGKAAGALADADHSCEGNSVEDELLDEILGRAALALCQLVRKELAGSPHVDDRRALQVIDDFLRGKYPNDLTQTKKKWKLSTSVIAKRNGWTTSQTQNALRALASSFGKNWTPNLTKLAARMGMADREQELQKLALPNLPARRH